MTKKQLALKKRCSRIRLTFFAPRAVVDECCSFASNVLHAAYGAKCNKRSAVAEMGDRARAKWAEKCLWLLGPFPWAGWAGSPSNIMAHGPRPRLPPYQVRSWSMKPFGHNTPTLQDRTDRQRSDSIGRTVCRCNAVYTSEPKYTHWR